METLGSARTKLAKSIAGGVCSTDERVPDAINEAIEKLVARGKWKGLVRRCIFCTQHGCVTLPREVEAILAAAVEDNVHLVFNNWYEFLDAGPGPLTTESASGVVVDRGMHALAFDPCGTDKRIRVYCDVAEAAGAQILLQGYDENGNRIRTQVSGEWVDGEYVNLTTPFATSVKYFTKLTAAIKPATNGFVRLYSVDGSGDVRFLATYHPDDERPTFRRYLIPGVPDAESDPDGVCVKALVKLRYLPVAHDEDELLIANIPALRFMCRALHYWDCDEVKKAELYEQKAVQELENELKEHLGGGISRLNIEMRTFGAGNLHHVR